MTDRQANHAKQVGLPPRLFLFTLDQIANMLDITETKLKVSYIWFDGRTGGVPTKDEMIARNIAPANEKPEWRVAENDFIRWLKRKGFRYHDRGWGTR